MYNRHVFFHPLGQDWRQDEEIFGAGRAREDWPNVALSHTGRWLVVEVSQGWVRSEVYLLDRSHPERGSSPSTPASTPWPAPRSPAIACSSTPTRTRRTTPCTKWTPNTSNARTGGWCSRSDRIVSWTGERGWRATGGARDAQRVLAAAAVWTRRHAPDVSRAAVARHVDGYRRRMGRRPHRGRLHVVRPTPDGVRRRPRDRSRGGPGPGRAAARIRRVALRGAAGVVHLAGRHAGLDVSDSPARPGTRRYAHAVDRLWRVQRQSNAHVRVGAAAVARRGRPVRALPICAAAASTARPGTGRGCSAASRTSSTTSSRRPNG